VRGGANDKHDFRPDDDFLEQGYRVALRESIAANARRRLIRRATGET
jgi:hypothetical protein